MVHVRGTSSFCRPICFLLVITFHVRGVIAAFSDFRSVLSTTNEDRIIQPTESIIDACSGRQISIVLIPGADILPSQYDALGQKFIQEFVKLEVPYAAWVGIPHLPFETHDLPLVVQRVTQKMNSLGMNATYKVYAGHSAGGVALADYVYDLANNDSQEKDVLPDTVLFLGSCISRKYDNEKFPVPSLTIGGSLDGLCRVTRMMESFVKQSLLHYGDSPVFVIEGMNHFSIANGTPPALVQLHDLHAEIPSSTAQSKAARFLSAFVSVVLFPSSLSGSGSNQKFLEHAHNETNSFLQPLAIAYSAEGFYSFKPPCSFNDSKTTKCEVGSKWVNFAQEVMAGVHDGILMNATIHATNEFHHAYAIPTVLSPFCRPGEKDSKKLCKISLYGVAENRYEILNPLDMGLTATSATEIKAKMVSRQVILEHAGFYKPSFTEYDEVDICASINKLTYDWALDQADPRTYHRFRDFGEKLIMGPDLGPYNNGSGWSSSLLRWETSNDGQIIRSPTLRTKSDYYIPAAAGFHYCKLLSPARAMEWVYVDGLRRHASNSTSSEKDVLSFHL